MKAGSGPHQAPVGAGFPEGRAAVARRAAGVLDGFAAAGRIGARVQRGLNEGRIGGADGVVKRLPAIAVAGFRVGPGLEQRLYRLGGRVVPGGLVQRRAAAGVSGVGVGATGDQNVDLRPVLGNGSGDMDELCPVAQPEPSVHAVGVDHSCSEAIDLRPILRMPQGILWRP